MIIWEKVYSLSILYFTLYSTFYEPISLLVNTYFATVQLKSHDKTVKSFFYNKSKKYLIIFFLFITDDNVESDTGNVKD